MCYVVVKCVHEELPWLPGIHSSAKFFINYPCSEQETNIIIITTTEIVGFFTLALTVMDTVYSIVRVTS